MAASRPANVRGSRLTARRIGEPLPSATIEPVNVRADRLPLVDSLRALAAISVLLTHTAVSAGVSGNPSSALSPYAQRLDVGVAIFFLISGLLLYRPFVRARLAGRPAPATGPYAWRRFLRIVPAYWVALTLTAVWVGTSALQAGVFSAKGAPFYYLLGQTYSRSTLSGGLTQAWTLTIEVAFYAFIPVYAWLQRRRRVTELKQGLRSELLGLLVLVIVSEVWKAVVLGAGNPRQVDISPALDALPSYLDQFALGMALAVLSVWIELGGRTPGIVRSLQRRPGLSWLFAAVAFWLVSTHIGISRRFFAPMGVGQYLGRHLLYAAVALGLLLPAVVGEQSRGVVRRLLSLRWLAWLGLISYGLYLWQTPVLAQLERWHFGAHSVIHPWLWWSVGTLAGTTVIAAASYYLLERPILSLRHLFDPARGGRTGDRVPPGEAIEERAPATPVATPD
jgi:peptidoglycan/LPS O-acetylase OafA/YrhL